MNFYVERINKKSPYWVIQLGELTFRFNMSHHNLCAPFVSSEELSFRKWVDYIQNFVILRTFKLQYQ